MADSRGGSTMWATLCYLDSMPDNFSEILTHFYIPIAVSPLHDKDINADGTPKKPHYHVYFYFGKSKKSKAQFEFFRIQINGVGCECIGSNRGYARYLCHLDNPDKAQYDINDVVTFGGYDYLDVISSSGSDLVSLANIIKWCNNNNCYVFSDLIDYCIEYNMEWFSILSKKGSVIREYMKSKTWKIARAGRYEAT